MELKCRIKRWRLTNFIGLIVPLWNWNGAKSLEIIRVDGFNRTFMELKLLRILSVGIGKVGFNRTFMELKLPVILKETPSFHGLIVPLWNWNKEKIDITPKNVGFNRTFMELKYLTIEDRTINKIRGLIVPLWNWNTYNLNYPIYMLMV